MQELQSKDFQENPEAFAPKQRDPKAFALKEEKFSLAQTRSLLALALVIILALTIGATFAAIYILFWLGEEHQHQLTEPDRDLIALMITTLSTLYNHPLHIIGDSSRILLWRKE
jgi:hypothetical protein